MVPDKIILIFSPFEKAKNPSDRQKVRISGWRDTGDGK
jgi:hypothetical protein